MLELFPPDVTLENLSGLTEPGTGVYYPAKGEGPDWYVSFIKCIYRLVRNVSVVGGLRVYKSASLHFGVKPGRFFEGTVVREYPGISGHALTNNADNYIYLTGEGTLAVSAGGFPDPAVQRHLRLATITVADGEYTDDDIVDHRADHLLQSAGTIPTVVLTVGAKIGNSILVSLATHGGSTKRFMVHAWLADAPFGAPTTQAPGGTVSVQTGTLLEQITEKIRWQVVTDSDGQASWSIGETEPKTWYLNVEIDGKVYAGGAIAF